MIVYVKKSLVVFWTENSNWILIIFLIDNDLKLFMNESEVSAFLAGCNRL